VELREIGRTGVKVPELALGTWQYRAGAEPLRAGIELGATFIDTAESYGTESIVGDAIHGMRERVFVASKVSPRHFRYADVIKAAECSLRQLKIDCLDLYQLHWPNYTVDIAETMAAMEKLVEMGKIRFIGVSNFSTGELRRAQSKMSKYRIVSNQVRYGLLDRSPEQGLLQYCKANQVSLLAFSPLGTDFAKLEDADPSGVIGQVAKATGKSRAQVALNWCLAPECVIAIFKSEKIEHVQENCGASGWVLTAEQHRSLSERVVGYRRHPLEQVVRRFGRRLVQHTGRNLGGPTLVDC